MRWFRFRIYSKNKKTWQNKNYEISIVTYPKRLVHSEFTKTVALASQKFLYLVKYEPQFDCILNITIECHTRYKPANKSPKLSIWTCLCQPATFVLRAKNYNLYCFSPGLLAVTVNIRDRHVTCNAGGGLATPVILAVSYPKSKRQCRSHKSQVATEPSTEPTANHLPYYVAYLSHFQNQNTNTNTNTVAHSPIHHDGIETNEQPHSPKRIHCGCYGRGRGECEPVDCCLTMPRISRIPAVPHRARDAGVMYELSSVSASNIAYYGGRYWGAHDGAVHKYSTSTSFKIDSAKGIGKK